MTYDNIIIPEHSTRSIENYIMNMQSRMKRIAVNSPFEPLAIFIPKIGKPRHDVTSSREELADKTSANFMAGRNMDGVKNMFLWWKTFKTMFYFDYDHKLFPVGIISKFDLDDEI